MFAGSRTCVRRCTRRFNDASFSDDYHSYSLCARFRYTCHPVALFIMSRVASGALEQVPTGSRKLRPANKCPRPFSRETGGPTGASLILHSRRSAACRRAKARGGGEFMSIAASLVSSSRSKLTCCSPFRTDSQRYSEIERSYACLLSRNQ
jgi:hypothetical protein